MDPELAFILLFFCLLTVFWQFSEGTKKYLESPVANKIYSVQAELPVITVCHRKSSLRMRTMYGISYKEFRDGKMTSEDSGNMSAEEVFKEAIDANYYLLDSTGRVLKKRTKNTLLLVLVMQQNCRPNF